jgi:hypothetical protein
MSKFTNELESTLDTISVKDIWEKMNDSELTPHNCQRDEVWAQQKKGDFIFCMFKGCKMSGLYANINNEENIEILDGQNRCIAITNFVNDELNIGDKKNPIYFKDLIEADKRKFKNIKIGITYLKDWDEDKCEDLFIDLQKGDPLTRGEKIQAYQSKNIISQKTKNFIDKHGEYLTKPTKNNGAGFTNKRYKQWEIIPGLFHMIIKGKKGYPVKIEKNGYNLFEKFNKYLESNNTLEIQKLTEQINDAYIILDKIIDTFKNIQKDCDKLKCKPTKEEKENGSIQDSTCKTTIFRCLNFIYQKQLYKVSVTSDIIQKFTNMLVSTHSCNTLEGKEVYDAIIHYNQYSDKHLLIYETYDKYFV